MLPVLLLIHSFVQNRFDYLLGMVVSPEVHRHEQAGMILALTKLTYYMLLIDH